MPEVYLPCLLGMTREKRTNSYSRVTKLLSHGYTVALPWLLRGHGRCMAIVAHVRPRCSHREPLTRQQHGHGAATVELRYSYGIAVELLWNGYLFSLPWSCPAGMAGELQARQPWGLPYPVITRAAACSCSVPMLCQYLPYVLQPELQTARQQYRPRSGCCHWSG